MVVPFRIYDMVTEPYPLPSYPLLPTPYPPTFYPLPPTPYDASPKYTTPAKPPPTSGPTTGTQA